MGTFIFHFHFPFYGGPQPSRQTLIPRGKRKLLTAKREDSRQKEKPRGKKKNLAAKRKRLTAKRKTSRQKEKPRGKKERLTAKRKTSRQKEKHSRQKRKDSPQKNKREIRVGLGRVFRSATWDNKRQYSGQRLIIIHSATLKDHEEDVLRLLRTATWR